MYMGEDKWDGPLKTQWKIDDLKLEIAEVEKAKNVAYSERDMLVCLLSKVFPSWLERHPDSDTNWEDDWRWIVFILLPTGQASWHIHDSELEWFGHLVRQLTGKPSWDGHTTDEKYERVMKVSDLRAKKAAEDFFKFQCDEPEQVSDEDSISEE